MIIILHSLYFVTKHLFRIYRSARNISRFRSKKLYGDVQIQENCERTQDLDLRFNPPLYRQRYVTVQQILLNENWKSRIKKVVEFGCSEMNFFKYMKHLYDINEIVLVDIDEETLKFNLFKVFPLTVDYLKRRPAELNVQVLIGNVALPDRRLLGADAVVAIELIEHLYPDALEAVPYNVFHYIKPLVAVFTTPNVEFNVLFPESKGFRHPDHKFEWTREQFQSWALNITQRFPNYTVQFDGIGAGPPGNESVGCCTQIAIFFKHADQEKEEQLSEVPRFCREISTGPPASCAAHDEPNESQGICTYFSYLRHTQQYDSAINEKPGLHYKELHSVDFPFFVDNRTQEERILDDCRYRIYTTNISSRFYNEEKDRIEYPLEELISNEDGCYTTVDELSKLLSREHFDLQECRTFNHNRKALCVVHYLTMENHNSSRSSSTGNSSIDKGNYNNNIAADESDWETDYNQTTIKINDEAVENEQQKVEKQEKKKVESTDCNSNVKEQKVTLQFHSTVPNTSKPVDNKEENKKERSSGKRASSSHSKLPSTSCEKTPKKGTNTKNRDVHNSPQSTSKENDAKKKRNDSNVANNTDVVNEKKVYKKSIEVKVHDSTHSSHAQKGSSNRNVKTTSNSTKSNAKGKIMTTSSLKRFPTKTEDNNNIPSTSDLKRKKKSKNTDETKEDIKALTECIIYNTLNNIPEVEEHIEEASGSDLFKPNDARITPDILSETIGREIVDEVLRNAENFESSMTSNDDSELTKSKDQLIESANQELNHASREALFDPNSETDMLEEFEIPAPPPLPQPPILHLPSIEQHNNIIVIGLGPTNEEETVVLPDNADPFPNWLLQLLGANVEEGESHDEPHFYCQGDGIGVHPSIIEVEIDEEESTSDSSESHHEAEAGYTSSDSGVIQLPADETDEHSALEDAGRDLTMNRATPGNTSAAESADEFFDTLEETLTINARPNSQSRKN